MLRASWPVVLLIPLVSLACACGAAAPGEPTVGGLGESAHGLQPSHIQAMGEAFRRDPHYRQMQNAVTATPVDQLALDRTIATTIDDSFSHKLDDWPVTNQKQSGRCWLFAGMNLLRAGAMKKMDLEAFEFSQNYLFFWDKIERANYFLEVILATAAQPDGDRTVDFLLETALEDGGQWSMFASLVAKHGLVPKAAMPESESSSNSRTMNGVLRAQLHEGAKRLRDLHATGATAEQLQAAKHEILTVVYRILSIHIGTPPERFDWQWRDKGKTFHRDGELTPREFAAKYVTLDLGAYVCLVHDPRPTSPGGRVFTVAYLGNVIGGEPIRYLNIDIDLMKEIARRTLMDGDPVWFGCDVVKEMSRELGLWDSRLFDFEGVYDARFTLTKADRLIYHETRMTHAMLFTGVDVVDGRSRRWRVENSWGDEVGKKGFFVMNDSWFDEYVFEIAAHKRYLPDELLAVLESEPIVLPPWDPMGSLARDEALTQMAPPDAHGG